MALASWFSIDFEPPTYPIGNNSGVDNWEVISATNATFNTIAVGVTGMNGTQTGAFLHNAIGSSAVYERAMVERTLGYEFSFDLKISTTFFIETLSFKDGATTVWSLAFTSEFNQIIITVLGGTPVVLGVSPATKRTYKVEIDAAANTFKFFINTSLSYTTSISNVKANTLRVESINNSAGPAPGPVVLLDSIVARAEVPTLFEINFEPPKYTLTGGPGSGPGLEGQDEWRSEASGATSMEITNNPVKVLQGTQSLQINIDSGLSPLRVIRYQRWIPKTKNYTLEFAGHFSLTPQGGGQVGISAKSKGNFAWFVKYIDGTTINFWTDQGSALITTIDTTVPHIYRVIMISQGQTGMCIFQIDGDTMAILPVRAKFVDEVDFAALLLNTIPSEFIIDNMFALDNDELIKPKAPTGAYAISRLNHTILKWNQVVADIDGKTIPGGVTRYIVSSASKINESDLAIKATIDTTQANGELDHAFVDTDPSEVLVYRIRAVAENAENMLPSDSSDRTVAVRMITQIDDKPEPIDGSLLIWDEGNWDEKLWV